MLSTASQHFPSANTGSRRTLLLLCTQNIIKIWLNKLHVDSFIIWVEWTDNNLFAKFFFPLLFQIMFFSPSSSFFFYRNNEPVPEVPTPTFHWRGDHSRQQHQPDLGSSWDDGGESNWRDVGHRSPHPRDGSRIPEVRWFRQQLWLISPAAHPWEQSVSNVKVSPLDPLWSSTSHKDRRFYFLLAEMEGCTKDEGKTQSWRFSLIDSGGSLKVTKHQVIHLNSGVYHITIVSSGLRQIKTESRNWSEKNVRTNKHWKHLEICPDAFSGVIEPLLACHIRGHIIQTPALPLYSFEKKM